MVALVRLLATSLVLVAAALVPVAWAGRDRTRSVAMRRANTNPSRSELLASRFAPCTPVHATSPQA